MMCMHGREWGAFCPHCFTTAPSPSVDKDGPLHCLECKGFTSGRCWRHGRSTITFHPLVVTGETTLSARTVTVAPPEPSCLPEGFMTETGLTS